MRAPRCWELNFYEHSPRCISLERAQEIAAAVGGRARLVGVFVNMNVSEVLRIARAVPLDGVQLHGRRIAEDCAALRKSSTVIRALKVDAAFSAARAAEFACLQQGCCWTRLARDTVAPAKF
jgi:phosphoribosylanthranilate isomerase